MNTFSDNEFKQKLDDLDDTFKSIQSLSEWIIQHRICSEDIIRVWFSELLKANISKILNLLYVANEVIQNSLKGGLEFKKAFFKIFTNVFTFIGKSLKASDSSIFSKFDHILDIWENRFIYKNGIINYWRFRLFQHVSDGIYGRQYIYIKNAFKSIHNPPSKDYKARKVISLFDPTFNPKSKVGIREYKREVSKTIEFVNDYTKRLGEELENRSILSTIMKEFEETQTTLQDQSTRRLQGCEDLMKEMQSARIQLSNHYNSLPDIKLLSDSSQLPPLPSPTDLFTRKYK